MQIRNLMKNMRFNISRHRSFKEAIITAGGVSTNEINSKTMESKLISGLFFAGEIIDLDAETGGFNLQIAFSTGWVAGDSGLILYTSNGGLDWIEQQSNTNNGCSRMFRNGC